jgi:hypothetical protein
MCAYCSVRGGQQYRLSANAQIRTEQCRLKPREMASELMLRSRILS